MHSGTGPAQASQTLPGVAQADTARIRRAVQQGAAEADWVVGTHPHVLQPWERMGLGVVLFSLGNFVFDLEPADVNWLGEGPFQTAVVMLTLSLDGPPQRAFRPVVIDAWENRPRPATDAEARAIFAQLEPVRAAVR